MSGYSSFKHTISEVRKGKRGSNGVGRWDKTILKYCAPIILHDFKCAVIKKCISGMEKTNL